MFDQSNQSMIFEIHGGSGESHCSGLLSRDDTNDFEFIVGESSFRHQCPHFIADQVMIGFDR
jgi:hypothetical protein